MLGAGRGTVGEGDGGGMGMVGPVCVGREGVWGRGSGAGWGGGVRSARSETTKDMTCTVESFKTTPSAMVTALFTGKREEKDSAKKIFNKGCAFKMVGRAVPLCENTKVEASVKCVFKRGVVFGGTVPLHKNTQEDAPVKCFWWDCSTEVWSFVGKFDYMKIRRKRPQ